MPNKEFHREDRYVVIKRSDLERIPNAQVVSRFLAALAEVSAHSVRIPQRKFLVIESDWPEYKQCWGMIEARVSGEEAKPLSSPAFDYEKAARRLAHCMEYPWQHMPEQGRQSMREHAKSIIESALGVDHE